MTPRLRNHGSVQRRPLHHAALATVFAITTASALVAPDLHAQNQPSVDVVRRSIDGGNAKYVAAMADMNHQAFAQVYDPAGSRFNEGGRVVRGHVDIAYAMSQYFRRTGRVQARLETLDLWVVDNLAYETGNWTYRWTPQDQPEIQIGGKYVTVWRKQQEGGWRIWADMGVPGTEIGR